MNILSARPRNNSETTDHSKNVHVQFNARSITDILICITLNNRIMNEYDVLMIRHI